VGDPVMFLIPQVPKNPAGDRLMYDKPHSYGARSSTIGMSMVLWCGTR